MPPKSLPKAFGRGSGMIDFSMYEGTQPEAKGGRKAPTELNSSDEEDFNEVDEREGSYTEATEPEPVGNGDGETGHDLHTKPPITPRKTRAVPPVDRAAALNSELTPEDTPSKLTTTAKRSLTQMTDPFNLDDDDQAPANKRGRGGEAPDPTSSGFSELYYHKMHMAQELMDIKATIATLFEKVDRIERAYTGTVGGDGESSDGGDAIDPGEDADSENAAVGTTKLVSGAVAGVGGGGGSTNITDSAIDAGGEDRGNHAGNGDQRPIARTNVRQERQLRGGHTV